jgi:hypothetical protein
MKTSETYVPSNELSYSDSTNTVGTVGKETRPKNVAVYVLIKAQRSPEDD